jgi:hypothetical protein
MEVGHLLENQYDDWTVWSVATTNDNLSKSSYCNKGWHKEIEEVNDIKLDHTNDSNITQIVQENVALTHEGTCNQTFNNLSVLTALHSRKEGIWHRNDDTWGQTLCLTKIRLQMATWYALPWQSEGGENIQLQVDQPTPSNDAHCHAWHEQCTVGRLVKLHHFREFLEFNTKDFQKSSQMIHSREWLWVPPSSYSMATKGSFTKSGWVRSLASI